MLFTILEALLCENLWHNLSKSVAFSSPQAAEGKIKPNHNLNPSGNEIAIDEFQNEPLPKS